MISSGQIVLQNAVSATGNGNTFDVSRFANLSLQVLGTFTATVTFEGSNDGGTTWAAVPFINSSGTNASTASAAGIFTTYNVGYLLFRARVTWVSGTSVTVIAVGNG